jgi:hypothetical protein
MSQQTTISAIIAAKQNAIITNFFIFHRNRRIAAVLFASHRSNSLPNLREKHTTGKIQM